VPLQWAVSITDVDAPHFNEWGLGDLSVNANSEEYQQSAVLPKVLQCDNDKQIAHADKQRCHHAMVEEVPEKYIKNGE